MSASSVPDSDHTPDRSIAVLPFMNMSADPDNEYFSDGITEEIINALTSIQGLRVIARTSSFAFKGKNIDIREIGQQLGVKTILEGSVRKAQRRVRITAQLIKVSDGSHYWSKNFDRELEDLFALQDEVSLLIADQIRENFGHLDIQEPLVVAPTDQLAAYELYLKGRQQQLRWTPESLRQAVEYFDAAIQADPKLVRAYYSNYYVLGLLTTWGFIPKEEGYQRAGQNFLKGQELDRNLPEYPMSFVARSFWGEWNLQETYHHIQQTLSFNPRYSDALEAMTELFLAKGSFHLAQQYLNRAMEVDPLSANHHYTQANLLYMQEKYAAALPYLQTAIGLNPALTLARELELMCLIWLKKAPEFADLLKELEADKARVLDQLYRVIHQKDCALDQEEVAKLAEAAPQASLVPYELFILAQAGEFQMAWDILSRLVAEKRGSVINFQVEPFLKALAAYRPLKELHQFSLTLPAQASSTISPSPAPKMTDAEMDERQADLWKVVDKEKAFLDAELSLRKLAEAMDLHPNKLSFMINERYAQNFNEFINRRRLDHFKQLARSPQHQHLTLLALAYESGFSSKSVFNTFFKKQEGMTPSAWVKNL